MCFLIATLKNSQLEVPPTNFSLGFWKFECSLANICTLMFNFLCVTNKFRWCLGKCVQYACFMSQKSWRRKVENFIGTMFLFIWRVYNLNGFMTSKKICTCFGQLLSLCLGHYTVVLSLNMFMSQGHISGFFRLGGWQHGKISNLWSLHSTCNINEK